MRVDVPPYSQRMTRPLRTPFKPSRTRHIVPGYDESSLWDGTLNPFFPHPFAFILSLSPYYLPDHMPMHIRQPSLRPVIVKRHLLVIQPQQMHHRRVKIIRRRHVHH